MARVVLEKLGLAQTVPVEHQHIPHKNIVSARKLTQGFARHESSCIENMFMPPIALHCYWIGTARASQFLRV